MIDHEHQRARGEAVAVAARRVREKDGATSESREHASAEHDVRDVMAFVEVHAPLQARDIGRADSAETEAARVPTQHGEDESAGSRRTGSSRVVEPVLANAPRPDPRMTPTSGENRARRTDERRGIGNARVNMLRWIHHILIPAAETLPDPETSLAGAKMWTMGAASSKLGLDLPRRAMVRWAQNQRRHLAHLFSKKWHRSSRSFSKAKKSICADFPRPHSSLRSCASRTG